MLRCLFSSPFQSHAVVTRKRTGLGSDLISVLGALHYAKKTERDVIIDWRRSRYLSAGGKNLFPLLFQIPEIIDNVRVHIAPHGFWMPKLARPVDLISGRNQTDESFHDEMTRPGGRIERSVVITRPMHYLPDESVQRTWLSQFALNPNVQSAVDAFHRDHMAHRQVVGIHIRHGNGENLGSGRNELVSGDVSSLAARHLERINAECGEERRTVFLCTDSLELRNAFMALDKSVVSFDSSLGSANSGPIHTARHGLKGAYDALTEMALLGRCHRLYFTPSWFSHYARIVGNFLSPPVNLNEENNYGSETLYWKKLGRTPPPL